MAHRGETSKALPGWYAHPTMAHTSRYWDGEAWTDHLSPAIKGGEVHKPESPVGLILLGFIFGIAGGVVLALGAAEGSEVAVFVGYVLISLSGIVAMIGIIGAGVRLGMRHADFERQQREAALR